jgi:iron complex transport system substrate-binding protein
LSPAASFDDYFRNLERLGALLGRKEKAEKAVARARRKLKAWREADAGLPDRRRPKVLVAIDVSPVITAGKPSFLTSMIELAGGRNVAAGEDRGYFNCSLEQVALWDPDVILAPGLPEEKLRELEQSPAWSGLSAVKRGNVITDLDPDWLYRLGPRTLDGVEALRERLAELVKR